MKMQELLKYILGAVVVVIVW